MKRFKNISIFIFIFILLGLIILFIRPTKDNRKNTIRILIDRYPNSQKLDANYRKIAPLIEDLKYSFLEFQGHEKFMLIPQAPNKPQLEFIIIKDETTRVLTFIKNEADVLYDNLSLSRYE